MNNLKKLIKEVESCQYQIKLETCGATYANILQGIKQTVEAVDNFMGSLFLDSITISNVKLEESKELSKDWQTLKKLLGIK